MDARQGPNRVRIAADLALALLAVHAILAEIPRIAPSGVLWDYGSFLASGRAAREGLDPFGIHPPLTMHVSLPGFEGWNPNLNPPISAVLFRAFDLFDPAAGFLIWRIVSFASFAAAVMLLVAHERARLSAREAAVFALFAFGHAGFWDTLFLGQIYLPLALGCVAAFVLSERGRPVAAGLIIGVVAAIKPNLLVWPGLLFLAGRRREAFAAAASFLPLSAIPLLIHGPGIYARWFELVASDGARAAFLTNAAPSGLFARAGVPGATPFVASALLAGAALWAFRTKPDARLAGEVGLLAALLASPLAWVHYMLFLLPLFLRLRRETWVAVPSALLLIPVPFVIARLDAPPAVQMSTGSIYNWALLLLAAVLIRTEMRRGTAASPASQARAPRRPA